jgi:hypothetical protein
METNLIQPVSNRILVHIYDASGSADGISLRQSMGGDGENSFIASDAQIGRALSDGESGLAHSTLKSLDAVIEPFMDNMAALPLDSVLRAGPIGAITGLCVHAE